MLSEFIQLCSGRGKVSSTAKTAESAQGQIIRYIIKDVAKRNSDGIIGNAKTSRGFSN